VEAEDEDEDEDERGGRVAAAARWCERRDCERPVCDCPAACDCMRSRRAAAACANMLPEGELDATGSVPLRR